VTAVESFSGIASAQLANITATTATALRHPVYSAIKDPRRCATRLTPSVIARCGHCKADLPAAAFRHPATRGVHSYDNLVVSAKRPEFASNPAVSDRTKTLTSWSRIAQRIEFGPRSEESAAV
jgi:hypothetical protein